MNFDVSRLKDMAHALGLSTSTVSKALRDSYEISPKTKQMVVDYAKSINYKPNTIARSLRQGKTMTIGIVVSTVDNHFFSQVISGIESIAVSKGYKIIITQTHESAVKEMSNIWHLKDGAVDGLIISLSTETTDVGYLKQLQKQDLPVVLFDRVTDDIKTHKVVVDNYMGAYEATKHLLERGRSRIAHITSSNTSSISKERLAGYKYALKESGVPFNEGYVKFCLHGGRDLTEIQRGLDELFSEPVKPDAIFTASDRITTTTLMQLNKMQIAIPDEIALIGFTNTILADLLSPSLSTIVQPAFDIGRKAIEMLIEILESRATFDDFKTVVLPAQLFIRNSTGKS